MADEKKFTVLATHVRPTEEVVGMWLLQRNGEKLFPGISTASIVFSGAGGRDFTGKDAKWAEDEGVICVGIAGGEFDEHPRSLRDERKKDECAATLVARKIGLRSVPWYKEMLDEVCESDLGGKDRFFDLMPITKLMYRQDAADPHAVIKRVYAILDRLCGQAMAPKPEPTSMRRVVEAWATNRQFGDEVCSTAAWTRLYGFACKEFVKNGEMPRLHLSSIAAHFREDPEIIFSILDDVFSDMRDFEEAEKAFRSGVGVTWREFTGSQGTLKVALVESDSGYIEKVARLAGAQVTVQFRSTGNVQIFTKKIFDKDRKTVLKSVDLRDLVRLLRLEEQFLNRLPGGDPAFLESQEGSVKGAEAWWYFPKGAMLLNGSNSHPDARPTRIPRPRIIRIVELAFSGEFAPQYSKDYCEKGACAGKDCPFYPASLLRCRKIRYDRMNARQAEVAPEGDAVERTKRYLAPPPVTNPSAESSAKTADKASSAPVAPETSS